MKKLILLMLAVTLAAMPVLSCATTTDDPGVPQDQNDPAARAPETPENGEPEEEETVEALRFPDLPDVNFGGYNFRILNSADAQQAWILTQLVAEEETGEPMNDAIFRRNRRIEERFGFNLVQIDGPGPANVRDRMRISIQAGSDDFDLGMMTPEQALSLAQPGLLEMIDMVPHVDLTKPWWDQDMIRDFSIGRRVFFTSGDFSFNQYSVTIPLIFNKELHADLGLDCPYTLVREGRWTIDRLGEQARAAARDLDGDGVMGPNDQWGFMGLTHVYTLAMMNGVGARYIIKDADDMPMLNMNTEGFISRFYAVFDIMTEGWLFDGGAHGMGRPEPVFLEGRALFWAELMNWATILRGMDADFGILPVPKLNEQQEHHISGTGLPHVMAIPITTQDLERTGIILEALNAESRLTTRTVYFDTMLVNQIMNRDEESAEMLDIIFANRVYETGRFFWEAHVAGPIHTAMRAGNRDLVSILERHEPAALAAITATINAFVD